MRFLPVSTLIFISINIIFFSCQSEAPDKQTEISQGPFQTATEIYQQAQDLELLDFDSALVLYEKAVASFQHNPERSRTPEMIESWAKAVYKLNEGYLLKIDTLTARAVTYRFDSLLLSLDNPTPNAKRWTWLAKGKLLPKQKADSLLWLAWKDKSDAPNELAAALQFYLGKYYQTEGQADSAKIHFEKTVNLFKDDKPQPPHVSDALLALYNFANEEKYLEDIIKINKNEPVNTIALVQAYRGKAINNYRAGKIEKFREFAQKAYDLHERVYRNNYRTSADLANVLGVALQLIGEYESSLIYFQRTIDIYEKYGPKSAIPGKLRNQGNSLNSMGRNDEAIEKFKESIETTDDVQNILSGYNDLGITYAYMKEFELAEEAHHKSLELKKKEVEKYAPGGVEPNAAMYRERLGWLAKSHFLLGHLCNHSGKHAEAVVHFNRCKAIRENQLYLTDGKDVSNHYYQLGWSFEEREMFDEALKNYQKSIHALVPSCDENDIVSNPKFGTVIHDRLNLLYPLSGKGTSLHQRNIGEDASLASQTFHTASNFIDSIRLNFTSEGSKENLMELARLVYEGGIEHAVELYEKSNEASYLEEAFGIAEKSKSVVLGEAINDSKVKFQTVDEKRLQREASLKKDIGDREKAINDAAAGNSNLDEAALAVLKDEVFVLRKEWQFFMDSLEADYPVYRDLKYNISVPTIQKVQEHLKKQGSEKTAVIEYFLGDSTLVIFGITHDRSICQLGLFNEQMEKDIELLREIVSNSPGSEGTEKWKNDFIPFTEISQRLYQSLLEPVLDSISVDNLVIIPDGVLGYLPFQVLLTDEVDKEVIAEVQYQLLPYLVNRYNIRSEYSARLLLDNINEKKDYKLSYAGFAPVYPKKKAEEPSKGGQNKPIAQAKPDAEDKVRGSLEALNFNLEEVKTVCNLTRGKAFYGNDASEENFKNTASSAAIVHLSMHGIVDDVNPMYSQLAFSKTREEEEFNSLYAYELYNMSIPAELAVLSACNTGYGKLKRGEGIMSLSRAFKFAGCPNILMTLWPANDITTKDIVTGFFENLKLGQGKDEALSKATRSFIKKSYQKSHPFYWAHFLLIGNETPVAIGGEGHSWLWMGGLLVLFALGIFIFKNSKRVRQK